MKTVSIDSLEAFADGLLQLTHPNLLLKVCQEN